MNAFVAIIDIIAVILSLLVGKNIKLRMPKHPRLPLPDTVAVASMTSTPMNRFRLGLKSKKELLGVHPKLIAVVKRAIQLTDTDFTVFDGKRSAKEQNQHYKNGVSQLDGYDKISYHQSGNAVDLVPVIDGRENHKDWDNYYHLAEAMVKAAKELKVAHKIRWGAVWDRRLSALPTSAGGLKKAAHAYTVRHAGKDFLDGPHWEWRD